MEMTRGGLNQFNKLARRQFKFSLKPASRITLRSSGPPKAALLSSAELHVSPHTRCPVLVTGKLRTVLANGYERLLEIVQDGKPTSVWVSALEPEHYAENHSVYGQFREGEFVELEVMLKYVTKIELQRTPLPFGMRQPIPQSPHTVVVARVTECSDPYEFVCSLSERGPLVVVETETAQVLAAGQLVAFSAELAHVG